MPCTWLANKGDYVFPFFLCNRLCRWSAIQLHSLNRVPKENYRQQFLLENLHSRYLQDVESSFAQAETNHTTNYSFSRFSRSQLVAGVTAWSATHTRIQHESQKRWIAKPHDKKTTSRIADMRRENEDDIPTSPHNART